MSTILEMAALGWQFLPMEDHRPAAGLTWQDGTSDLATLERWREEGFEVGLVGGRERGLVAVAAHVRCPSIPHAVAHLVDEAGPSFERDGVLYALFAPPAGPLQDEFVGDDVMVLGDSPFLLGLPRDDRWRSAYDTPLPPFPTATWTRVRNEAWRHEQQARPRLFPLVQPVVITAADVKVEPLRFLVPGYVPCGMPTFITGRPGVGKSLLTVDLIARVTRGAEPPGGGDPIPTGDAVMVGLEDDAARVVRPRLEAAGADLRRVHFITSVHSDGADNGLQLPDDLGALEEIVRDRPVRLVVIDPISDFVSGDLNREKDVRAALIPLNRFAQHYDIAVIIVRHSAKARSEKGAQDGYDSGVGSVAFGAVPRAGFAIHSVGERRLLQPMKANLAPPAAPLAYTIVSVENPAGGTVGRIEWLDPAAAGAMAEPSEVERACEFIREQLREGAVVLAREMYERAEQQNIAKRTLEQAKKTLGVRTEPKSGPKAAWSLPVEEAAEPGDASVAADPDYEADEAVNDTAA